MLLKKIERCNFWTKEKACFGDKDLSSWIGLGGPVMSEVRVLVQFRTLRAQNWLFEVMSHSFGIIFRPENSRAH